MLVVCNFVLLGSKCIAAGIFVITYNGLRNCPLIINTDKGYTYKLLNSNASVIIDMDSYLGRINCFSIILHQSLHLSCVLNKHFQKPQSQLFLFYHPM